MSEIVTVKVQRPIFTTGSYTEVMSYIVDDDDERISPPAVTRMKKRPIKRLFGDHHKVYYLAEYEEGKPVRLTEPTREDEWE